MYPVAGGTVRAPKKDVMLAGKYIIPARTTVFLPVRTPCEPASMQPCMGTMAPILTMDRLLCTCVMLSASRHQLKEQMCVESVSRCFLKGVSRCLCGAGACNPQHLAQL